MHQKRRRVGPLNITHPRQALYAAVCTTTTAAPDRGAAPGPDRSVGRPQPAFRGHPRHASLIPTSPPRPAGRGTAQTVRGLPVPVAGRRRRTWDTGLVERPGRAVGWPTGHSRPTKTLTARLHQLLGAGLVSTPAWRGRRFFTEHAGKQERPVAAAEDGGEHVLIDAARLCSTGRTLLSQHHRRSDRGGDRGVELDDAV